MGTGKKPLLPCPVQVTWVPAWCWRFQVSRTLRRVGRKADELLIYPKAFLPI